MKLKDMEIDVLEINKDIERINKDIERHENIIKSMKELRRKWNIKIRKIKRDMNIKNNLLSVKQPLTLPDVRHLWPNENDAEIGTRLWNYSKRNIIECTGKKVTGSPRPNSWIKKWRVNK